jgi:hypothetical protein
MLTIFRRQWDELHFLFEKRADAVAEGSLRGAARSAVSNLFLLNQEKFRAANSRSAVGT